MSDYSLAEYMAERDRLARRVGELRAALRKIAATGNQLGPGPLALIAQAALDRDEGGADAEVTVAEIRRQIGLYDLSQNDGAGLSAEEVVEGIRAALGRNT